MLEFIRDYFIIRKSGYFDARYYLVKYPDIRRSDVAPLMHYVRHGWREGRYPSAEWESIATTSDHVLDKNSARNPLVEYIKQNRGEKVTFRRAVQQTLRFYFHFLLPFWRQRGIVFYGGYPYPEREKDGYYQRIRAIDSLFTDRWRIYIDSVPLAGRDYWHDIPEPRVLVLRPRGRGLGRLSIEFWIRTCVRRAGKVYLQSVLSSTGREFFWGNPRITKIIDVHGAVPEEFKYQGEDANSMHFERVERAIIPRANTLVVVSEAMRAHLANKFMGQIPGKFIILPNIQEIPIEPWEKSFENHKPIVIYAGGVQVWQQIPKIIDAIMRTSHLYHFKLYSPYPQEILALLPEDRRDGNNPEVESKTRAEIIEGYHNAHYGFILRDDRVVNRVACPTKLVEYLAAGVIPIVDSPDIGDFKTSGMQYVTLENLLNYQLPPEPVRQHMAEQNYSVYSQILYQYKVGVRQLKQILTPGAEVSE